MQSSCAYCGGFARPPGPIRARLSTALRNPTVNELSQTGWVAVETVIDEHVAREIIPSLKAAGAEGIIEYPLNKVVY